MWAVDFKPPMTFLDFLIELPRPPTNHEFEKLKEEPEKESMGKVVDLESRYSRV